MNSLRVHLSLSFLLLPLWSIGHPWNILFHFSLLILGESVGLHGWGNSQSQGRYVHRTTETQNKCRQTSMPCAGVVPTIPLLERANTVHDLYGAATVIDLRIHTRINTFTYFDVQKPACKAWHVIMRYIVFKHLRSAFINWRYYLPGLYVDYVYYSELLGFWTFCIVRYS
jgi:hypothetical protein